MKNNLSIDPPAKVPALALSWPDPFSFGSRGRSPSTKHNELPHKALHCKLEGETPGEPREWKEPPRAPNVTFAGALIVILGCAIAAAVLIFRRLEPGEVQRQSRFLMDTYCTIQVPGTAEVSGAISNAFERMADIDRRFNALNPQSPVYQFNVSGTPIADREIVDLVGTALDVAARTDGAFDITVYPLVERWGFYGKVRAVPAPSKIEEDLKRVGWQSIAIEDGRVIRRREDVRIDLGGIAKGYAVGEAVRALKASGVRSALVDAGGDIYAFGQIRGRPWRVGIRNPRGDGIIGTLELSDESVTTSGDYERFFDENGVRYHHILDPHTGYPARGVISATVVSSNAALADAWSTAVFVLGAEKGLKLIEQAPGLEAFVVTAEGERLRSPGLKNRLREIANPPG